MDYQEQLEKNIGNALNPFDPWYEKLKSFKNNIVKQNSSPLKNKVFSPEENIKQENKNQDFNSLNEAIQDCFNCPFGEKMKGKNKIPFKKNLNAKVMMLGEMPHYEDQEVNQKYFSSSSIGSAIENILYSLKIYKDVVYFSTILKCHSTTEKRNEIFNHLEKYSYCEKHLKSELDLMPNIRLIIVFGEIAYWLLTRKNDFDKERGNLLNYYDRKIFFTDSIQNALLSSEKKVNLWQDFKKNNLFQDFNF